MRNADLKPAISAPEGYEPDDLWAAPEVEPRRPRRWRRALIGVLFAAAALVVAAAIWRPGGGSVAGPALAVVDRGDIVKTIAATGKVQAVQTVQVGSQISGTISALLADFNDKVRKGQVIARLDSAQLEAQLAQARANQIASQSGVQAAEGAVMSAEANVAAAQANVERMRLAAEEAARTAERNLELFRAGVLARQALESSQAGAAQANAQAQQSAAQVNQAKSQLASARSQLAQARAQEAQARAAVEIASVNLSRSVITAPVDGVVIARNVDVGQTVAASLQAPVLYVIANDLTRMLVLADIDEADVGQLRPSAKVSFTVDAFPRDTFEGRISQIRLNPQTVQNVVTYTAVIEVDNPDLKLKPGMTANVSAVAGEAKNALRIPNSALRFRPADAASEQPRGPAVWKQAGEGQLAPVRVRTGLTDGVHAEVIGGGLREGDRVAVAAEPAGAQRPAGPGGLFGRPGRR